MSKAPAPDAGPAMCPGLAVKGGGGGSGGSDGDGNASGDGSGGKGKGKGEGASGDGKGGGDACGDPICPITGRMFLSVYDFGFAGPQPLAFVRSYSSRTSNRDGDFGHGWSHPFGLRLRTRRRQVEVLDHLARRQVFRDFDEDGQCQHPTGLILKRADTWVLRAPRDGLTYVFGKATNGWHWAESVTDRNGNSIRIQRDDRGHLHSLTDSANRPIRFTTDQRGHVLSAAIATGPEHLEWMTLIQCSYDDQDNLVRVTDAESHTARYHYDRHLMVEHASASGLSYFYRYDGRTHDARCLESWGEYPGRVDHALEVPILPCTTSVDTRPIKGIHHVKLTYGEGQRYTEVEDACGGVTRYFGDDLGRVIKIVDPAGGVTERAFDPATGGLVGEAGPNGVGPIITRYADGTVMTVQVGAEDILRGRFVDEHNEEVTFDERRNAITRARYDARGNIVFIRHPDNTIEEFDHDERGLLRRQVTRQGATIHLWHDAMGNCVTIHHGGNNFEFNRYDYLGRRIHHTDTSFRVTEWSWDNRSEITWTRRTDGVEVRVERDANRCIVMIDEGGRVTRCEYGGMAWPTKVTRPGGSIVERRYGPMGHCTWIRNARGQEFRIRRDNAGRCAEWQSFEGVVTKQGYDVAGNFAWLSTPEGQTTFEHNELGHLVNVEMTHGGTIAFEHGPDGTTSIDNGHVAAHVDYDAMGRVLRDRQGPHELDLTWHGGELAEILPTRGAGSSIHYGFDVLGGLSRISVGENEVKIDETSKSGWVDYLGKSLVQRRHYDLGGRLDFCALARRSLVIPMEVAATQGDPGLISLVRYEYDRHGNLAREEHHDGRVVSFENTIAGQVARKRVLRKDGSVEREELIGYDPAGTVMLPGVRFDAQMRPVRFNNEELSYDANGRLCRRLTDVGEWRYHWTDDDLLTRVEAPDRVVELSYDGRGRRMRKRVRRDGVLTVDTRYVWANNIVVYEINELNGDTRTYFRTMGSWSAIGHVDVRDGQEHCVFYMLGPNGGLRHAVDERGTVVWQAEQTVYGDAIDVSVDTADVQARFANHFYDPDVELVYAVLRWYDPRVGLFVTPDPAILFGNSNPRDYAENPLREIDPCGLVTTTNNPLPTQNPGSDLPGPPTTAQNQPIPQDRTGAPALSRPGGWAVGSSGANGSNVPGYAPCPTGAGSYVPGTTAAQERANRGLLDAAAFPASTRAVVNAAGNQYGCHTCGATSPGTSGHWIPDHQPPRSSYSGQGSPNGGIAARGGAGPSSRATSRQPGAVRLYPHCNNCSTAQRNALSAESSQPGTAAASRALTLMGQQT